MADPAGHDDRPIREQPVTRRVVTGLSSAGEPQVVSDGAPPRSRLHVATPGMVNTVVWSTPASGGVDPTAALGSVVPGPGETVGLVVTFPPDAVYTDPSFDAVAAGAEQLDVLPGLAELFEADSPGMHQTPTVDYAVVLDGQLVLDLGATSTPLGPGDIVVQNGTRHAWRNPSDQSATLFVVLVGAPTALRGRPDVL